MASAAVAVLPPPNVEEELVYRVFVYEPRYTDRIFPISYSHRFSNSLPFISIEKGDILGKWIIYLIICFGYIVRHQNILYLQVHPYTKKTLGMLCCLHNARRRFEPRR